MTVYSCTLMIGRYSDQSKFRAGFSLASECFHCVVPGLAHPLWVELADKLHSKLLPVQWSQNGLGVWLLWTKDIQRIVYISHGWACDVFIHTCSPASHKNLKSCEDELWVRMWLLCSYSNAILHFWLLRLQYSEFHNCIGHLKMSLLLSLTLT